MPDDARREREVHPSRTHCGALSAAVETSDDGVRVSDHRGSVLYENVTLQHLLTEEHERRRVEEAMAAVGRAAILRPGDPFWLHVRTSRMEYRARGTALDRRRGAHGHVLVVWLRRCRPSHLTPEELRDRHGLTPREVRVATIVAGTRCGTRDIAEILGISPHTVRRHVEAVLRKLRVHSRAEVRERLRIPDL
jgi:DNA-binding CsgD family transcriptional regulator